MDVAQAILRGLGYTGTHVQLLRANHPTALDAALQALGQTRQKTPTVAARFAVAQEKRSTLEMALDHLIEQAPMARGRSARSHRFARSGFAAGHD